jgi:hypothetical protein
MLPLIFVLPPSDVLDVGVNRSVRQVKRSEIENVGSIRTHSMLRGP